MRFPMPPLSPWFLLLLLLAVPTRADHIRTLQTRAIEENAAEFGHWGYEPDNYTQWGSHSNRLIPVYTYGTLQGGVGVHLHSYTGANSPYRRPDTIRRLYEYLPHGTLFPEAAYLDQTSLFDLQRAALEAGKKHIILVIFDGMDWQTTWAASICKSGQVGYLSGRGHGLHFQDYRAGGTSEFGWMVTSPFVDEADVDVNTQQVQRIDTTLRGGYAHAVAGATPWAAARELKYLVSRSDDPDLRHAYTDSASSATSMTAGIKTYNAAINVDPQGGQATTIAHLAQRRNYRVGVVTSVPISHATPAAAYAHNVHRNDYQDLTRDLLGLPSVSHPDEPLPGVDLLIGAGFGASSPRAPGQGENFVPGNLYLTDADRQTIDVRNGGRYVVAEREAGVDGAEQLREKTRAAAEGGHRLFGFYGVPHGGGHLPYQTADGNFDPTIGRKKTAEEYTLEDLKENPTLADMTAAALDYLARDDRPFWLMVEPGDVDWANHDNNIDNSIGAVLSGDAAVKVITDWVERHSSWDETVLIVTADHGHLFVLNRPELLLPPADAATPSN